MHMSGIPNYYGYGISPVEKVSATSTNTKLTSDRPKVDYMLGDKQINNEKDDEFREMVIRSLAEFGVEDPYNAIKRNYHKKTTKVRDF